MPPKARLGRSSPYDGHESHEEEFEERVEPSSSEQTNSRGGISEEGLLGVLDRFNTLAATLRGMLGQNVQDQPASNDVTEPEVIDVTPRSAPITYSDPKNLLADLLGKEAGAPLARRPVPSTSNGTEVAGNPISGFLIFCTLSEDTAEGLRKAGFYVERFVGNRFMIKGYVKRTRLRSGVFMFQSQIEAEAIANQLNL